MLPDPPTTFESLGLEPSLLRAAAAAGWLRPSAIQAAAIPAILQGRDLLARAATGSGKTAAFVLPLLHQLLRTPGVGEERPRRLRALVLAPTRELAVQIGAAAQALAPSLKTVVAVGGLSINPQMLALRGGAHLLVATPGRLLDLTRNNAVHLGHLQVLVLDEADRLLAGDFAEETQRVLALAPRQRQTLLFSATLTPDLQALIARGLHEPLLLDDDTTSAAAHTQITQRAIVIDTARRQLLLRHLLRTEAWPRALVFVATQYASEHLADKLRQAGVAAAALHGSLSQGRRGDVLADLQTDRLNVLVATDLAARGIDVVQLPVVVNFDLPRSADDYVHRIGRTGRAGAQGLAISFICADAPGSEAHFRLIEKRQGARVAREHVAGFEPALPPSLQPVDPNGGIKGRRKSKKDKLREAAAARLSFEPARASEAAEWIRLRGQTRENAIPAERLAALGITPATWGDDVRRGVLAGYVCRDELSGGRNVGYCFGDTRSGEVVVLALLPTHEGQGIGARLLDMVVRTLRERGHERLFLGCSSDPQVRSHGFYRHLGWRSTGQLDGHGDEVLELLD